jgi:mono/diheme cytochrome c family protein
MRHTFDVRATLTLTAALIIIGTPAATLAQSYPNGQKTFASTCAVCHQISGAGNPALAPPLLNYPARYLGLAQGREQLLMTVLYGMYGDIVVENTHYNFRMPSFAALDDETIAQTLNYVAFELAHAPAATAPITAAEVGAMRAKPASGAEVRAHRTTVLTALGL